MAHRNPFWAVALGLVATTGACGAKDSGDSWGPGDDYRSCGTTQALYTTPVVAVDQIRSIEPLGHVFVPGHTFPSDHTYINLKDRAAPAPVRAPAAIRVWQVALLTHRYVGGPLYSDYTIRFSPCREVAGYFHHLPELRHPKIIEAAQGEWDRCDEFTTEQGEYQRACFRQVAIDIDEGEVLAETGNGTGSGIFDWGAYDKRIAPLPFVNPARMSEGTAPRFDYLRTVCPIDAFDDTSRSQLQALLGHQSFQGNAGNVFVPRIAEPICGTIMQDLAGTAQGDWVAPGYKGIADFEHQMALVHDNLNPTLALLATGGGAVGIHDRRFPPKNDGLIDRDFSAVAYQPDADNPIYCYELPATAANDRAGRMLLQMTSSISMMVEVQSGVCADGPTAFGSSAIVYQR